MIGHQAIYAMSNVDLSKDDYKTEIIYNFLLRIKGLAERFETPHFIFCWDSPTKSLHRKNLYPEYKENRDWEKKTPEEQELMTKGREQFLQLRKVILPALGFNNIIWERGYESDDLMASITKDYAADNDRFVIVTADKDMYQCLEDSKVSMFDPDPRRLKKITASNIRNEHDIEPHQWADMKVLAGCNSDNVKGIEGVGESTALKYLKHELPTHYKIFGKIVGEEETIRIQNEPLIVLPFSTTPHYNLFDDELSSEKFKDLFNKLGFASFLNKFDEWKKAFEI